MVIVRGRPYSLSERRPAARLPGHTEIDFSSVGRSRGNWSQLPSPGPSAPSAHPVCNRPSNAWVAGCRLPSLSRSSDDARGVPAYAFVVQPLEAHRATREPISSFLSIDDSVRSVGKRGGAGLQHRKNPSDAGFIRLASLLYTVRVGRHITFTGCKQFYARFRPVQIARRPVLGTPATVHVLHTLFCSIVR